WRPPILRRPATTTSRVIGSDGVARGPKRGWPGLGARRFRSSFGIPVSERRLHEPGEERVRIPGPRAELGMELAGDEVGMLGQLHDLDKLLLGPQAGDAQTVLLELRQVIVVELVAMAVSLLDDPLPVQARGPRALAEEDRVEPQSHGAALVGEAALLGQQ